jgi:hypothetical protein
MPEEVRPSAACRRGRAEIGAVERQFCDKGDSPIRAFGHLPALADQLSP